MNESDATNRSRRRLGVNKNSLKATYIRHIRYSKVKPDFQQNSTTSTIDLIITMLVFILLLFFFHLSYVFKENALENVTFFIIL